MRSRPPRVLATACLLLLSCGWLFADESPQTGPITEQRFPPLVLPEEFQATLFACDPLVEYPSVIALGPASGSLFVAHDYVTGLGVEIVRRDEIRLLVDSDGDDYADRSIVYATGFNSIQGLTYHDGAVFAMHSPQLTMLRDVDGDGIADQRRELLDGLGLAPEDNRSRLHCGNGIIVGHDGWLYLALGDNGCDVARPEGDRLLFQQGGILRCRTDGTDLHVFASGLRNIYDVALDEDLNVFVRDNENDGGDYKIRICHSIFAADHGYPYLYYERPDEALRPLADLGLGAAAGGVCYLEDAFPPRYRGLFFCEWGRAIMRFPRVRAGSSFASGDETQFAYGAEGDPYGFKPTDVIVDRDGSLVVSDWADGQRPKRGRGRIYRIRHNAATPTPATGLGAPRRTPRLAQSIVNLDSSSQHVRLAAHLALQRSGRAAISVLRQRLQDGELGELARCHAAWLLAQVLGDESIDELLDLAGSDVSSRVRAQAIRAIADLTDPVLTSHRLLAGRGDADVARQLARIAENEDPLVVLESVIAMGRLAWADAPTWLARHLQTPDSTLAHAAMQTLRRCDNWPAVLRLLELPDDVPLRAIAERALARQYRIEVVDGLVTRLKTQTGAKQIRIADLLARVYKKPPPWKYWGYRPGPRPTSTIEWARTLEIEQALDWLLQHADPQVKTAVLPRIQREAIPVQVETIASWLTRERDEQRVAVILDAVKTLPVADVRQLLKTQIRSTSRESVNRLTALQLLIDGFESDEDASLLQLAAQLEDGPVLAAALRGFVERPQPAARELLMDKLASADSEVRTAAIEVLGVLGTADAAVRVPELLADVDVRVRRAAAAAAGKLAARQAIPQLLAAASESDSELRKASLEALRLLDESRAVPAALAALDDATARLAALAVLADLGAPAHLAAVLEVAGAHRTIDVLGETIRVVTSWQSRATAEDRVALNQAVAQIQGDSGLILRWVTRGPLSTESATELLASDLLGQGPLPLGAPAWQARLGTGTDARTDLSAGIKTLQEQAWLAVSEVAVERVTKVNVLTSSTGALRIWLGGKQVFQRDESASYRADADQFEAQLSPGANRFVVQVSKTDKPDVHLRFLPQSSSAEDTAYIQHVLKARGSSKRGREVFFNLEKSRCLKCHQLGSQGARIGPNLTAVGDRFSKIHLIESILEPSRTIAPSYNTYSLVLNDGRILSGVRVAEDAETITVGDTQGKQHVVRKTEIEERHEQPVSTMPDRLEKDLSKQEFADLIAFLLSQRKQ